MSEPVICLACGLPVYDPSDDAPPSGPSCRCQPSGEAASVRCPDCGAALTIGARACAHCGSTVASARCSACLAWNLASALHCQACGRPLEDGKAVEAPRAALQCPRCQGPLGARRYAELALDECDRCGGIFVSPEAMNRIVTDRDLPTGLKVELPARPAVRETDVHYIHCPVCSSLMNRSAFGRISGVVVDVCRKHGVWFDGGELSEVVRFVESGGLARARERDLADAADADADQRRRERTERLLGESPGALRAEAGSFRPGNGEIPLVTLAEELVDFVASLWR